MFLQLKIFRRTGCSLFIKVLLLFQFFLRLLLVILQIHDGFLSKLQITLQFSLGSLKVHTELLFLLQRTFKLTINMN